MRRGLVTLLAMAVAAGLLAAACGGSGGPSDEGKLFPDTIPLGDGEVFPVITNNSLSVGANRFSLGLLDSENLRILDAKVHLAFYDLGDGRETLKTEADPRFIPVELSFVDERSNRETRLVGDNGVYVTPVTFGRAGPWGVLVTVTLDGKEQEPVPFRFAVLDHTREPAVGEAAPASRQTVFADVEDIAEIDSSYPARPQMHEVTVADALALGKPIVLAFATPAFCESRICGPVMDTVMDPLYEKYGDEATFIHIEPYDLAQLRTGTARVPVAATADWGIQTEPWVFVIDGEGKVAAKFEGIVALDEVETALLDALGRGA
jgi:hypothetical protein